MHAIATAWNEVCICPCPLRGADAVEYDGTSAHA